MSTRSPFAHVLHQDTIAKLARGPALSRGRIYFKQGRVRYLRSAGGRLLGEVAGTESYEVSIWVAGDRLGYACSCPRGADGDFCKHCVAVALAWIERPPDAADAPKPVFSPREGQWLAFVHYFTKIEKRAPTSADAAAYFSVPEPAAADTVASLAGRGLVAVVNGSIRLLLPRDRIPDLE